MKKEPKKLSGRELQREVLKGIQQLASKSEEEKDFKLYIRNG